MTDGIWLVTWHQLHVYGIGNDNCTEGNIGRLLDPTVALGGNSRIAAEAAFRPMLNDGPNSYSLIWQDVRYTIDTDRIVFDGALHLGPYNWHFRDGGTLSRSWVKGGAGKAPPTGVNPNYVLYDGEIRHTYDYHGRFLVFVEIVRTLRGNFQYHYTERFTYDETWGADLGGAGNAWNQNCPDRTMYTMYRLPPATCETIAWDYYNEDARDGTPPPPDPLIIPPPPPITCATETDWFADQWSVGGGYSSDSGGSPGTPECSYGGWYNVSSYYNVLRAWGDYYECHDTGGNPAGTINPYAQCYEQHAWNAPSVAKNFDNAGITREPIEFPLTHAHIPGYGNPRYGIPVRRVRPFLVPNP